MDARAHQNESCPEQLHLCELKVGGKDKLGNRIERFIWRGSQFTMSRETCERLTAGKHTPEHCLEAAFQYLLDREPKESILRCFDVTAISRYFPEFEREMPRYLSQS